VQLSRRRGRRPSEWFLKIMKLFGMKGLAETHGRRHAVPFFQKKGGARLAGTKKLLCLWRVLPEGPAIAT
jgi:hypothetical protein